MSTEICCYGISHANFFFLHEQFHLFQFNEITVHVFFFFIPQGNIFTSKYAQIHCKPTQPPLSSPPVPCFHFRSVLRTTRSSVGHEGRLSRDLLPVFCGRPFWAVLVWAGACPLDVVRPAFPLSTTASHPPPQVPRRMIMERYFLYRPRHRIPSEVPWRIVFGEAVVACPNRLSFRLLTETHTVGGLVFQDCWSCVPSRRYEEVPSGTWSWKLGSFFSFGVSKHGPWLTQPPPKGGRGCLMSPPCLESQGCHLIPLCYLLSCSSA